MLLAMGCSLDSAPNADTDGTEDSGTTGHADLTNSSVGGASSGATGTSDGSAADSSSGEAASGRSSTSGTSSASGEDDSTGSGESTGEIAACDNGVVAVAGTTVEAVYFAQTHVSQPSDPYFGLTANRDVFIKAHVTHPDGAEAPPIIAMVELDGEILEVCLTGPGLLPSEASLAPGEVQHTNEDSFVGTVPGSWIAPATTMSVAAGESVLSFDELAIGAPTEILVTMIDIHWFEFAAGDYPEGWETEFANNWPAKNVEVRRTPDTVFEELVVVSDCGANRLPELLTSLDQFDDHEQGTSARWNGALRDAAGTAGRWSLYYTNIYGVPSGGQAGGYGGVGNGTSIGILNHEMGHAMGLPHWGNYAPYPYRGDMHGIPAPDVVGDVHVGPVWAFDQSTSGFLTPIVGPESIGGIEGTYKRDPMQGGGTGDQEEGYVMRPLSDFSVFRMRQMLEGHVVAWNEALKSWAAWDPTAQSYSDVQANDGVRFPIVRDTEVLSVMVESSGIHPEINLAYPPIGPYTAGIIQRFDPGVAPDRELAAEVFCPPQGCDVSVRIMQGGVEHTSMLALSWRDDVEPCDPNSYGTAAVNLAADDGAVTSIELLRTPDAQVEGIPATPQVLASWSAN